MEKRSSKEQLHRIRLGIGEWMREGRERLGLSQVQLAAYLQISLQALVRYEDGDRSPSLEEIWRFLYLPGISIEQMEVTVKRWIES